MRIAFILPGLHRVVRGAEVAFESVARELATYDDVEVTLFGSGEPRKGDAYTFIKVECLDRRFFERWPKFPVFRNEYTYEELTFCINFLPKYHPSAFDITVTCSYPFVNWALTKLHRRKRPAHVFVTQNGDHPVHATQSEYRYFECEGLICTNPEYFERNHKNWASTLIPNGVDPEIFYPGAADRSVFGLPTDAPIVLMVSALIEEKRVLEGIRAAAQIPELHLVVCGDGPERAAVQALGDQLMPGRFHLKQLTRGQMPDIYRAADVFLHMSLTEPSANSYIEALATGLPIVTQGRDVTLWTLENTSILIDATDLEQVVQGIQAGLSEDSLLATSSRRDLVARRFFWSFLSGEYYKFFIKQLSK